MSNSLSRASLSYLLGISPSTPLDTGEMLEQLQITVLPAENSTPRLQDFLASLMQACTTLGIRTLDEQHARQPDGRFRPGIVIIAPGSFPNERLAINRVSTLYNNIIVGIHDEPPPVTVASSPQEKLDRIVGRLAWEMVHISIYVSEESWTICTMNGGFVRFQGSRPRPPDVEKTLVPKLSAQVVPPKPSDLACKPGGFQTQSAEARTLSSDFSECGKLWSSNSALLTHTSRESLAYRNPFYRKIVSRYLDERSGMSYGFFARQLPVSARAAVRMKDSGLSFRGDEPDDVPVLRCGDKNLVPIRVLGEWYLVEPVAVTVVTTRSGCRKTALDPTRDLVAITLDRGKITLMTPDTLPEPAISKPSFDTLAILSHALGNLFLSSVLQTVRPSSMFPGMLAGVGASMTHWHGYPHESDVPEGYFIHGENKPPVSCSTPQSAVYSLLGKIEALEESLQENREYRGDIHIEPNHGTNIVGVLSLAETAAALNRVSMPG